MEEVSIARKKVVTEPEPLVNPLRNERIRVRYVNNNRGLDIKEKSHVLYGGLAEGSKIELCVPKNKDDGAYRNALTKSEKDFLEEYMGLDSNALSVYRKVDNFWENYTIVIGKEGLVLNLNSPEDYIKYKVLRLCDNIVAKSLEDLKDRPKNTYRFVLVKEGEEEKLENTRMDAMSTCYREFGRIEDNVDKMRILVELMDSRPYSPDTQPSFLKARMNVLIQQDPQKFLEAITDPLLNTKVLLKLSVECGKVAVRNDYYYIASDGTPMCDPGENSTFSFAVKWLNSPAQQNTKALLEAEVSKRKKK